MEALSLLCGKWTINVVLELSSGARRYTELEKAVPGVSQKMLSRTLRRLEQGGIVNRTAYPTVPPTVEYDLTEAGEDVVGPLKHLRAWAARRPHTPVEARQEVAP